MSRNLDTDAESEAYTLDSLFERSLTKYSERDAVSYDGETYSYAELDERSNALANALVDRGVSTGDRVALLTRNRVEYVTCVLGVVKSGATMLPLNSMLANDDYEYMLTDSGAGTLICGSVFAERVNSFRDSLDVDDYFVVGDSAEGFEEFDSLKREGDRRQAPEVDVSPDDPAGHFYTGGTTGKPKGVVHTHRSLSTNAYSHLFELDISGDERLLLMTPLTHSAGAFMWASLLTGAESVVRQGFEPERALSDIEEHGITWTFMVPTMIYQVLDSDTASYDTSSLETLIYGAAPMTPARLREGIDEFGAIFKQFYGQTEVPNLITTLGKKEHALAVSDEGDEDVLSSAGQDCLMNRVRIVDPETGEEVEDGDEGEIVVSSPYTMEGYYEMPDETQETLKDGWLHTGDVGKKDSDGYVYLLDRKSNMIITGGMNVYSTEVEEELDEHPDVKEVAVIGIPDDKWGEAVTAVVVPRDDGLTADEIKEFADGRLADYKKPKNVEFVNSIPKTPYGKMDKKALREPYWEEEERDIR